MGFGEKMLLLTPYFVQPCRSVFSAQPMVASVHNTRFHEAKVKKKADPFGLPSFSSV